MPTVQESLMIIRTKLGNPSHGALPSYSILVDFYEQLQHLLNKLSSTDTNYLVGRKVISVDPSSDEYRMPSEFGRALIVETWDEGNIDHIRREVQICDVQQLNLYWNGVQTAGDYGNKHTAIAVAFFRDENQDVTIMKIAPTPAQAGDYRIWFDVNRIIPVLSQKPKLMENFSNLLHSRTCLSLVPKLMKDPGFNKDMIISMRDMFAWEAREYGETFDNYILQSYHDDTGDRRAFNSSRMSGYDDDW